MVAVHANQLVCAEVCQRNRARNDDPAEAFSGKEHLISPRSATTLLSDIRSDLAVGQPSNNHCNDDEDRELKGFDRHKKDRSNLAN